MKKQMKFMVKNIRLEYVLARFATFNEAMAYANRLNDGYDKDFGGRPFYVCV